VQLKNVSSPHSSVNIEHKCRVKVLFRFDLAAWAIEFCSSAVDAVLRCLYSQPMDVVSLCQGLDRQRL